MKNAKKMKKSVVNKVNKVNKVAKSKKVNSKPAKKAVKASKVANVSKVSKVSNVSKAIKDIKAVKKPAITNNSPFKKMNYPKHPKNPFRIGSAYSCCFNILASFKQGINRKDLVKLVSKEIMKDERHSYYDTQVILSAKESNSGPRHRSCKEGFWIKKDNDHITLMIDGNNDNDETNDNDVNKAIDPLVK